MKREQLTKEHIKFDLQAQIEHEYASYKDEWRSRLFRRESSSFVSFAALGVVCCIVKVFGIAILCFSLAAVALAFFLVPMLIRGKRLKERSAVRAQMLKSESFRIVGDTLERARPDGGGLSIGNHESAYMLVFSRYGRYFLPSRTNYSWSKDYYMSPQGVYNTSIEGDRFYLVIYPTDAGDEIGAVYNTKLFELTEDDPFDYEELL